MNIKPFKTTDFWIVARNVTHLGDGSYALDLGEREINVKWTYDACWSGVAWSYRALSPLKFDSVESAQSYIDENWDLLEST